MKTIKEASKGIPENRGVIMSSPTQMCEVAFKSGVEFAQRWIPVEEELPPLKQDILVKSNYEGKDDIGIMRFGEAEVIACGSAQNLVKLLNITHWRPIERK